MAGGAYPRGGRGVPLGARGRGGAVGPDLSRPWESTNRASATQPPAVLPRVRHVWTQPDPDTAQWVPGLLLRWTWSARGWWAVVVIATEQGEGHLVTIPSDQVRPVESTAP